MDYSKEPASLFNKFADLYQSKYMNVDLYGSTFDLFCNLLPPGASVLELACGPGNITRHLLNKRPDLKICASDLAPAMVELARKNNPEAIIQVMDCRNISALREQYDGIMCGFCLPYLTWKETEQLISDAAPRLRQGGVLYISTMEDDHAASGLRSSSTGDQLFMHYYTEDDLSAMLRKSGFQISHVRRIKYPAADGSMITDLIIIAQRHARAVIRKVRQKDNGVLATLIRGVFEEHDAPKTGTVYSDPTTDDLYTLFEKNRAVLWVAEEDNEILGLCGIFPTPGLDDDCAELVKFYVKKKARGKGLGKKLMQKSFDAAREMGYRRLYLESMPAFDTAVRMYEQLGFRRLAQPLGVSGHTSCNIWMIKDIN